jgi:hypothetical protein
MEQPHQPPPFTVEVQDVSEALRRFVERTSDVFEATADGLVRVRVGSSMTVVAVEYLDPSLDDRVRQALEVATQSAVNGALKKALFAATQALSELNEKVKIGAPSSS